MCAVRLVAFMYIYIYTTSKGVLLASFRGIKPGSNASGFVALGRDRGRGGREEKEAGRRIDRQKDICVLSPFSARVYTFVCGRQ